MMYRAGIHNEEERARIRQMVADGLTNYQIAQRTGVSPTAIQQERAVDSTRGLPHHTWVIPDIPEVWLLREHEELTASQQNWLSFEVRERTGGRHDLTLYMESCVGWEEYGPFRSPDSKLRSVLDDCLKRVPPADSLPPPEEVYEFYHGAHL